MLYSAMAVSMTFCCATSPLPAERTSLVPKFEAKNLAFWLLGLKGLKFLRVYDFVELSGVFYAVFDGFYRAP